MVRSASVVMPSSSVASCLQGSTSVSWIAPYVYKTRISRFHLFGKVLRYSVVQFSPILAWLVPFLNIILVEQSFSVTWALAVIQRFQRGWSLITWCSCFRHDVLPHLPFWGMWWRYRILFDKGSGVVSTLLLSCCWGGTFFYSIVYLVRIGPSGLSSVFDCYRRLYIFCTGCLVNVLFICRKLWWL